MTKLVHNVLWPAVAGNVLWAFLQLAVGDGHPRVWSTLLPRLLALLFIGVFLSRDWIDTSNAKLKGTYWLADLPIAAAIAVFAIATQAAQWWAWMPLIATFLVAVVGHLAGAWDEEGMKSQKKARAAFAGMNSLGVIVAGVGAAYDRSMVWPQAAAIALVVVLFLSSRPAVLKTWPARRV